MQLILSASKDTYITNKIIRSSFRVTDANLGEAGTLDLFKLYDESIISGETNPIENSRLLIKFDMSPAQRRQDIDLDINDSNFKAFIELSDVYGGQTTPSNFKVVCMPLAQVFDEGSGRNVVDYSDLGATNYLTASVSNGTVNLWNLPGAFASGSMGDSNIDVYASGTLNIPAGDQLVSFTGHQRFISGEEDLKIDVTTVVSGVLSNQIPDYGFLIALTGSLEKDNNTYFVKRFASRNAIDPTLRPKLSIYFRNDLQDHREDLFFNVTGSIFLANSFRSNVRNILNPKTGQYLTGDNCMKLTIKSGSFEKIVNCSQHKNFSKAQTGIYSASFDISEMESEIRDEIIAKNEVTFKEIWSSNDFKVGFYTGSFTMKRQNIQNTINRNSKLLISVTNLRDRYEKDKTVRFKIFIEDNDKELFFKKKPFVNPGLRLYNVHYGIKDFAANKYIVGFDKTYNSTLVSVDSEGMYFDFDMTSLPPGRVYSLCFLVIENGEERVYEKVPAKFRVEV